MTPHNPLLTSGPKCALYARVSTKDKDQETSNQTDPLESYAQSANWTIYHTYVDHETGTGARRRPQFDQMMRDASHGRFKVLLFWSLDRLSREGTHRTLDILRQLDSYGVLFRSYQEQYLDTLGPFREAVIGILAAVARLESQHISERVKAGMERAQSQGIHIGRKPAEIPEAELRKMVGNHWSLAEIARVFNVGRSTIHRRKKELGI